MSYTLVVITRFRCNICDKKLKCIYMGKNDVVKHCQSNSHLEQAKALKDQPKLSFEVHSDEDLQRTEAELQLAVLTASSNIALAFHDRLSPTIRKIFPKLHPSTTLLQQKPLVC